MFLPAHKHRLLRATVLLNECSSEPKRCCCGVVNVTPSQQLDMRPGREL